MSIFSQFDLDERILRSLEEIGYQTPTPIQAQAIPKVLEGSDLMASAQTGTGKTAAFLLPLLHQLISYPLPTVKGPRTLVLVPTRELAIQVSQEAKKYSKYLPKIKTACVYGGIPYFAQKKELSRHYDILVATPGRLIDYMEKNCINLSNIKLFVLDEADRMLDMGFIEAVEQIAAALPKERQTLLFSATLDKRILPISKKLQRDPHEIRVERDPVTQNNIEQRLYYVDNASHKIRLLEHLLENAEIQQTIVFTSTINQADELATYLYEKGYLAGALHGKMNQRQRTRTIDKLRKGTLRILIATDVAARGIDIASLSHVINFDLPYQPEDFIHRIGRTGRAGAKGLAITFATYREEPWISKINQLMGKPISSYTIEGMEPQAKAAPKHKKHRDRPPFASRRGQKHSSFRDRSSGRKKGNRKNQAVPSNAV